MKKKTFFIIFEGLSLKQIKKLLKGESPTLNDSKTNSCFSAILDPPDPYENYPHKKVYIKKEFWLQPQARA